jgi:VWFA-related protein
MKASVLAVSILLASTLLPAQAPAPSGIDPAPDQGTMTLKQEVRNVVVDLVVTGKHGQPVTSLDKASFQVLENGVPQSIAFFEQHQSGTVAPTAAAQPAPTLPANVHTNVTAGPADGPLLVLLLDALNTPAYLQAYVRSQILDYLKEVPPGTHMAIFTLSGELKLIQGFTSDPAVLKAALDGKSYPATATSFSMGSGGGGEGMRLGGVTVPFASDVAATRASLTRFSNEQGGLDQELTIRYTLDALNAMSVYLAGIPGRKSLLWFSASVPWTINPDFSLVTTVTGRDDYTKELKNLADAMTVGRISIYPISAVGVQTPPGYGADSPGSGFAQRGVGTSGANRPSPGAEFGNQELRSQMNAAGDHMSMETLAQATGGRAIFNTNGLSEAVGKVQAIGENYYTLAYSPTNKHYDGSLRKIEVRIDVPDAKLDYRRGYYADDPAKSTGRSLIVHSNPLRAVMQRGAPDATQIAFKVQVDQAARQPDAARLTDRVGDNAAALKGPFARYEFHWTVDLNGIQFSSTPDGLRHAEVDASLAAYDAGGTILNNIFAVLPLALNPAQYARLLKTGLPMKQVLDIPEGQCFLRAAVLDPSDGHTGATEFPLTIEKPRASVAQAAGRP